MTEKPDDPREEVADIRAELKDDLLRAARARQDRRSSPRRFAPLLLGVALAAVPATLAVAELSSDDGATESALRAPAPIFAPGGAYAKCPGETQELIIRLDGDLDAYATSPGYPVAGCPTAQELSEALGSVDASEPKEGVVTLGLPDEGDGTLQSPARPDDPGKEGQD
jgi:hypothetical protein